MESKLAKFFAKISGETEIIKGMSMSLLFYTSIWIIKLK